MTERNEIIKESIKGLGEIEYDTNISQISRVMSLTLGLPP